MLLTTNRAFSHLLPAQMERLQRHLHSSLMDFHNGLRATQGVLSTNVWNKEGEMLVRFELPGAEPDQISVDIHENRVFIKAELKDAEADSSGKWLQRERSVGTIEREFQFPFAIDAAASTAEFHKGLLELKLVAARPVGKTSLPVTVRSQS